MLNKELFKKEITEAYEFEGQKMPEVKIIKRMYEECIYLTDDVFIETMRNLINTYDKVSLPNILKSLPQYKRTDPPRNIEEYCKEYLPKSYNKDKMIQFLETERFTEEEKEFINKLQIEMEDTFYEIKPCILKQKFNYNIDNIIKAIRREKENYGWGVDLVETFNRYVEYAEYYFK